MKPQIKVVLTILQGPDNGKNFNFNEQDNFLLGRDAQGSHAHYRLDPEDEYVSRNHFLIEINPPDCYLRDTGSLNGTLIVREIMHTGSASRSLFFIKGRYEKDWPDWAKYCAKRHRCTSYEEAGERIKLEDGDLIVVGETNIGVKIDEKKQDSLKGTPVSEQEIQQAQDILHCIHCGKNLPIDILRREARTLTSDDFICKECLEKQDKKPVAKETVFCRGGCGRNVSSLANSDGRAKELKDIALYWCEKCADSKRERTPISRIGNYRIIKELGSGGFGVVYLARDETTGRIVALKITKEKIKRDEKLLQRFKREIEIMKTLNHRNLVKLYDDGISEKEENYYFVSEYLPEGSVSDLLKKRNSENMPYKETCRFMAQALDGLTFFHEHDNKFVHRDLKPENIFVRKDDKGQFIAKIGDFGLARSYILHGGTITKPGEWAGTIFYCPPEQITNFKNAKPYSDVYAMGMSLYHLITGEFPYDFPTRKVLLEMISRGEKPRDALSIILGDDKPIPIEEKITDIPKGLAKAINKAINKDFSKRFDSADKFKKAIERYAI